MEFGMKISCDFITNSSCASFTIPMNKLTQEQINLIYNHIDASEDYIVHRGPQNQIWNQPHDAWHITENDGYIMGDTSMDNFDMLWFLAQIGVADEHINHEGCC
jgi:hypothetical protein